MRLYSIKRIETKTNYMRKLSTLYENILLTTNCPECLKQFIDSDLKKVELIENGPSEMSVRSILSYAKALSVHKTKKIGIVNVILN